MATYTELFDLRTNSDLRNRITVAVAVKAQGLIDGGTPTAAEITWAQEAIRNPASKADELFVYVLAKNKDLNVTQIQNATDSAIQTQIDAAVDAIVAGGS